MADDPARRPAQHHRPPRDRQARLQRLPGSERAGSPAWPTTPYCAERVLFRSAARLRGGGKMREVIIRVKRVTNGFTINISTYTGGFRSFLPQRQSYVVNGSLDE